MKAAGTRWTARDSVRCDVTDAAGGERAGTGGWGLSHHRT